MNRSLILSLAADAILLLHVLFVLFVIVGLTLVLAGKALEWSWVRDPRFRLAHLVAIIVVIAQAWLGIRCPLTSWEMALRLRASDGVYSDTFVSHWLGRLLYYQAPAWVFAVAYTVFGVVVLAAWVWVRPRPFRPGPH